MNYSRLQEKFSDYKQALARLRESLDTPLTSSVIVDGTIQRFEFT